jgi:hypothetical protein
MPIPFKIKVTKNILELSKECGTHNDPETIGNNCAIALALKDIFPEVFVTNSDICPFGIDQKNNPKTLSIPMPKIARDFVKVFDSLSAVHKLRLHLPEFEFSIDIPDDIISDIDIEEVKDLLERKGSIHERQPQSNSR